MVQPRLQKTKAQKAAARHLRTDAEDEYLDELLEDEEFFQSFASTLSFVVRIQNFSAMDGGRWWKQSYVNIFLVQTI
jgi:hypothetical protein